VGTITEVGEGRASGPPDVAVLTLGVDLVAPSLARAVAGAAETMTRVMEALRGAGLDEGDLGTARYWVNVERWRDPTTGRLGDVTGYRVGNLARARVRPAGRVAAVLERAVGAGANNVASLTFSVEDPDALRDTARAAAMADARTRAGQLARLGGVELGRLLQVSEVIGLAPEPATDGGERGTAPSPVAAGEQECSARLQVTYEIGLGLPAR
jgi:uncharacterized protein YggE